MTRVQGNGKTVSLHEVISGRAFDAAAGDTSRYVMRSDRAPFKTERVEMERHQGEHDRKMV